MRLDALKNDQINVCVYKKYVKFVVWYALRSSAFAMWTADDD